MQNEDTTWCLPPQFFKRTHVRMDDFNTNNTFINVFYTKDLSSFCVINVNQRSR